MPRRRGFRKNVFINCPFDEQYQALLRPLLFVILFLGYNPRIASERSDSIEMRLDKICDLIDESKFSIHDLSRVKSKEIGELYRMNMPFELGIEYGGRRFGDAAMHQKKCLILEGERYEIPKALSDLAGVDVKAHEGDPVKLVRAVRNWFVETVGERDVPSATVIWYEFGDFTTAFYDARKAEGYTDEDLNMMPVPEYIDFISGWIEKR